MTDRRTSARFVVDSCIFPLANLDPIRTLASEFRTDALLYFRESLTIVCNFSTWNLHLGLSPTTETSLDPTGASDPISGVYGYFTLLFALSCRPRGSCPTTWRWMTIFAKTRRIRICTHFWVRQFVLQLLSVVARLRGGSPLSGDLRDGDYCPSESINSPTLCSQKFMQAC